MVLSLVVAGAHCLCCCRLIWLAHDQWCSLG